MLDLIAAHWPLIVGGGFAIGFLIGITGVGAGSLTTPMLISGVGVPPAVAVGTDLLFAALTKASAAWRHQRLGNVDWPILGWLAAGSLPGAAAMLLALYVLDADTHALAALIRRVLAVMLVVSAAAIALQPWLRRTNVALEASIDPPPRVAPTFAFGVVLGALVALTSVGAGAVGVAALTALYPTLMIRRVVGTDIVHAVPLTLVSGVGHAGMGNVDPWLLATLLAGSVPGILLGSRVTGVIPEWMLRLALAAILVYAAAMLALKT